MKRGLTIYKEDQTDRSLLLVGVTKVVQNEEVDLGYFLEFQKIFLPTKSAPRWNHLQTLKSSLTSEVCITR